MPNQKKQEFAVIGLGRFGSSLALTLVNRGFSVLGIDRDRDIVQNLSEQITHAVTLDASNEDALREIDIVSFDTVVVAIGSSFEGNLMTTVALKSLGVKKVVCKATTHRQRDILMRVGADQVILPEHDAGRRLANVLSGPGVLDQLELAPGYSITELKVPKSMVGQTLLETDVRRRYGVTVLVVKRDETLTVSPSIDYTFQQNDLLIVIGNDEDITRMHDLT
jgi:trk system potassium uptake protein TrkA